jgi:hypothetical protein
MTPAAERRQRENAELLAFVREMLASVRALKEQHQRVMELEQERRNDAHTNALATRKDRGQGLQRHDSPVPHLDWQGAGARLGGVNVSVG